MKSDETKAWIRLLLRHPDRTGTGRTTAPMGHFWLDFVTQMNQMCTMTA